MNRPGGGSDLQTRKFKPKDFETVAEHLRNARIRRQRARKSERVSAARGATSCTRSLTRRTSRSRGNWID